MDIVVATLFLLLCGYLINRMRRAQNVLDVQLGVIGVFSIGYFVLPIYFKPLSNLRLYPSDQIAYAASIFLVFLVFVLLGVRLQQATIAGGDPIRTPRLDGRLAKRRGILVGIAFLYYLFYYNGQDITSYSAANFNDFFLTRSVYASFFAIAADISLAWIALSTALAWKESRRAEALRYFCLLAVCVGLLVLVGQRLAVLEPIIMLMAALALTGQVRIALRTLAVAVLILLVISPIAVAIRQAPVDRTAEATVGSFSYGDNPIETVFQSIVDRGDLLYVTVRIVPAIENEDPPGAIYYFSVLINPLPSALLPGVEKPYLLSTNGDYTGELSNFAWRYLVSTQPGSLSAFGGVVAYREFGWAGVVGNGLLTGVFLALAYRKLGRGGLPMMVVYCALFVDFSVRKVPPSFWEALASLMPYIPFLVAAIALDRFLPRGHPAPSG